MAKNYEGLGQDPLNSGVLQDHAVSMQEFSDSFSLWDWGKLPDSIPFKAEASAILAADGFEKLESPEAWREFSKSTEALALRKANRLGGIFNELGEELQQVGLRTHYLSVLPPMHSSAQSSERMRCADLSSPFRRIATRRSEVIRPATAAVFGKALPDYFLYRSAPAPKKIPLEFWFHWGSGKHSSILPQLTQETVDWSVLAPPLKPKEDERWDFPLLEVKTKYENPERSISLAETLAVSGLSASQLQKLLLHSLWTAGMLKSLCSKKGLELVEGRLEWAISEDGSCFLVSSPGPDELKVMHGEILFSKDILKHLYRSSRWYQAVEKAKLQAKTQGLPDWKKCIQDTPPVLPQPVKEISSQLYMALAQKLTGRIWFKNAWSFEKTLEEARNLLPTEVRA